MADTPGVRDMTMDDRKGETKDSWSECGGMYPTDITHVLNVWSDYLRLTKEKSEKDKIFTNQIRSR